jgi:hypothetical protein
MLFPNKFCKECFTLTTCKILQCNLELHWTLPIQNARLVSHLQHTFKFCNVVWISLCFAHISAWSSTKVKHAKFCNVVWISLCFALMLFFQIKKVQICKQIVHIHYCKSMDLTKSFKCTTIQQYNPKTIAPQKSLKKISQCPWTYHQLQF